MAFNLDPDWKENKLEPTTVLEVTIPPGRGIFLNGMFNADWEQAIVLYLDGTRLDHQLGSYGRKRELRIPKSHGERILSLAGWHKQKGTNTNADLEIARKLPWVPSKGKHMGNVVGWNDSGARDKYQDCQVIYIIE